MSLEEIERIIILREVHVRGSVRAVKRLGIGQRTMCNKLRKYGIPPRGRPDFPDIEPLLMYLAKCTI